MEAVNLLVRQLERLEERPIMMINHGDNGKLKERI